MRMRHTYYVLPTIPSLDRNICYQFYTIRVHQMKLHIHLQIRELLPYRQTLFQQYKALADAEQAVIFGGRLAEYKYYDMDKVIESALNKVDEIFG